ncbi:MAG: response regulator [Thermodesulfobacteriota bacterium]
MKFLIADDDMINLKVLERILKELGESELATNGQEAVKAYKKSLEEKEPFNAVFMDIMMPVMDGQEALQGIRNIEKEYAMSVDQRVPAIMATALDDTKNVTQAFFKGEVSAYIVKPFDKDKIFGALREAKVMN